MMRLWHSLIISFLFHGAILALLLFGSYWFGKKSINKPFAIEAKLVVKSPEPKRELLPRKKQTLHSTTEPKNKTVQKKPITHPVSKNREQVVPAPKEKAEKANRFMAKKLKSPKPLKTKAEDKEKPKDILVEPNDDYASDLSALSASFSHELQESEALPRSDDSDVGNSYYDQIYSLIKASFIVPVHIDGPRGRKLKADVRIFLASDGTLSKIKLEKPSGDDHFDKAVLDGARRVNNFGSPPLFLQIMLREKGLVVELCPFKCLGK